MTEEKITLAHHIPRVIPITEKTLEKAHTLCHLVRREGRAPHEWFSFLLARKNDPTYMVRDLLVVKGTKAERGEVEVSGEHHALAAEEVRHLNATRGTEYYIIGWLHSHANFAPGHSRRDHDNFEQLLNSISFNTERRYYAPFEIIESTPRSRWEEDTLIVEGEELEDGMIMYTFEKEKIQALITGQANQTKEQREQTEKLAKQLIPALQMRTRQPLIVGFGYSIVVNDNADTPYAEIGTREEKVITAPGKHPVQHYQTKVETQTVPDDLSFTVKQLYHLVRERIVFPPVRTRQIKPRPSASFFFGKGKRNAAEEADEEGTTTLQTSPAMQKVPLRQLNLHALTSAFLYQVQCYQSLYQFEVTPYSQYLDTLMECLLEGKNLGQAVAEAGLPQAQEIQGDLRHGPYFLVAKMRREMLRSTSQSPTAGLELAFMYHFVFDDKNEAIATWVPRIYEGQERKKNGR